MTSFEQALTSVLHEGLDPISTSGHLPPDVVGRARRGRFVMASLAALVVLFTIAGSVWLGAAAFGRRGLDAADLSDCPFIMRWDMSVYLRDDISEDDLSRLRTLISETEGLESMEYVSKDEAMAEFRRRYEDQPEYSSIPQGALPASLRLMYGDGADLDEVAAGLQGRIGVDDVRYNSRWLSELCDRFR